MDIRDRVVIVTGATGTIGRGICHVLGARGMKVVVADLNQPACEQFAEELVVAGYQAIGVAVDVTSGQSTRNLAAAVVERLGSIDVLVNNAGIIGLAPLQELEETVWDRVIDVNLKGSFLCAQAVVATMIAQRRGRIINFASVAAARPAPLQSAYAASKSGILGLTRVWCQELAVHDITVNTICPGFIDSPMWSDHLGPAYAETAGVDAGRVIDTLARASIPLGRPQQPADFGEAVAYISSADNVSGHTLYVDGGLTLL
jgi:meso-butanediol dehydrogenase / (S,S)-butanediol dehydrogenase / diacetyl reductase